MLENDDFLFSENDFFDDEELYLFYDNLLYELEDIKNNDFSTEEECENWDWEIDEDEEY